MSEKEDQIIQLLKEIRDNQIESAKRAQECAESAKKQYEDYAASLKTYDQSQAQQKKKTYIASVAVYLFLGIIAICSVLRVVFLIGR